jgi:glycerate-2-kinase
MMITNFKNLARNNLRKKALLIAEAGYQAIEISSVIRRKIILKENRLIISLASIDGSKKLKLSLNDYSRIFLIGIGKGSALASASLAKILGDKLTGGIAFDVIKYQEVRPPKINGNIRRSNLPKLEFLTGTHPLPSKQNVRATQKIIKLVKDLKKDDLLINFICGGGSALACASKEELKASQTVFKELTKKGADIIELNTVRKHLSEIKGGNLAKLAYPATIISLIVSDVPSNDLSMVASGPTVFDKTTKKDAEKILKKYNLLTCEVNRLLRETPKDKKYFKDIRNILFLSNRESVSAMAKKAKKMGFKPKIYSLAVKGEARRALLPMIEKVKAGETLLAAGETTVNLDNRPVGKGGRNMEAVLGAISNFQFPISKNLLVLSIASDGRDNTEAAGAIGDFSTLEKAKKLKLEPEEFLDQNNSFNFFKKTGDLIFVKSKSFNVSDLMIVLKE